MSAAVSSRQSFDKGPSDAYSSGFAVAAFGHTGSESRAADVVEEAENQLRNSQYRSLRYVHCRYEHGALILSGSVPSYYVKQVAQELVSRLDDVYEVVNDLDVLEE